MDCAEDQSDWHGGAAAPTPHALCKGERQKEEERRRPPRQLDEEEEEEAIGAARAHVEGVGRLLAALRANHQEVFESPRGVAGAVTHSAHTLASSMAPGGASASAAPPLPPLPDSQLLLLLAELEAGLRALPCESLDQRLLTSGLRLVSGIPVVFASHNEEDDQRGGG